MSLYWLLCMGLTCLLVVLVTWWQARKRAREVILHRVTRKMERQIAEEIVRTRLLHEEVDGRGAEGVGDHEHQPASDQ